MILILCAIVAAIVVSAMLFWYADRECSFFPGLFAMFLSLAAGVAAIVYVFAGWEWMASEHKMKIINREYKTAYTREEIFYASSVIDTIKEIERNRVEVNGNIMRGKDR